MQFSFTTYLSKYSIECLTQRKHLGTQSLGTLKSPPAFGLTSLVSPGYEQEGPVSVLKARAVLAEDLGLVPSIHPAVHNHLRPQFQWI